MGQTSAAPVTGCHDRYSSNTGLECGQPWRQRSGAILLQKSFSTGGRKFCGPPMRFSCKDVGGLIASR